MIMLKVRFFLTDPYCKLSEHYALMIPRLDQKYDIEIETICKTAAEYETDEYFELDLPMAPGVMVGEEIVAEGRKISEYKLESAICRHLELPAPAIDKRVIYEFFRAILVRMNQRRKKWKAQNLLPRTGKLSLLKTLSTSNRSKEI
jgi:hypothetical protein